MLRGESLLDRFRQLDVLLRRHEDLWRPAPFCHPALLWETRYPALSQALRHLDDASVAGLEATPPDLAAWMADHVAGLDGLAGLAELPAWPQAQLEYPPGFDRDIPGRKWQQVTAFAGAIDRLDGPVLEWCAGKGHLARAVSRRWGEPVTGLERSPALCRAGNALSARVGVPVELRQCDVLSETAQDFLAPGTRAVALHACGDLHRRLLQLAAARGCGLHLSPCCYHLTADTRFRPLSGEGRRSDLALTRDELRLAVQETVTSPGRVARLRRKKNAWRLGFDALQRRLRGRDEYLNVPPLPDALFSGSFADFCRQVARRKGVELAPSTDWARFERLGWQREAEVARLELPRHALRRALELWLVLDAALFLAERGYRVGLGSFCERALTPRNLLLAAVPPALTCRRSAPSACR